MQHTTRSPAPDKYQLTPASSRDDFMAELTDKTQNQRTLGVFSVYSRGLLSTPCIDAHSAQLLPRLPTCTSE